MNLRNSIILVVFVFLIKLSTLASFNDSITDLINKDQFSKAIELINNELKKENPTQTQAQLFHSKGLAYKGNRVFDSAVYFLRISNNLANKTDNHLLTVKNFLQLGLIHFSIGDDKQSIDFYNTGDSIYHKEKLNDLDLLSDLNFFRVTAYASIEDSTNLLKYGKEAIEVIKSIDNKDAFDYKKLGVIARYTKKYNQSLQYLDTAIKLAKSEDDIYLYCSTILYKSDVNILNKGSIDSSLHYVYTVYEIADSINNLMLVKVSLSLLSEYYMQKSDTAKYIYFEKLFDSVNKTDAAIGLSAVKSVFIQTNKELNQQNKTKHSIFWIILTGLLITTLIFIYTFLRKKQQFQKNEPSNNKTQNEEKTNLIEASIKQEVYEDLTKKLKKFEEEKQFLSSNTTLAKLSSKFKTNQSYLSFVVKNETNKSFKEYINDLRMDEAKRRIINDSVYRNYSIDHMANEVGFKSRQAFSSLFKKKFNKSIRDYINDL